jgi:hypothetical protein
MTGEGSWYTRDEPWLGPEGQDDGALQPPLSSYRPLYVIPAPLRHTGLRAGIQ